MVQFTDLKPKVVLGVGAHPDDLDNMAGGTLALFVRAGAAVYYLVLTDGGKGTEDRDRAAEELARQRETEQREAGEAIGVKDIFFAHFEDCTLENTSAVRKEIVRAIRQVKPDVVVTMDPAMLYAPALGIINHTDHRAAGQATLDAVFPLARDHLSFTELEAEGLYPHKTASVLLATFAGHNYAVDIGGVLEQKCRAAVAHKSQQPTGAAREALVRQWAAACGEAYDMPLAEAFVRIDIK